MKQATIKKTKNKSRRSFRQLTPAERERDIARFDREIDIDKETRPLSSKERALFERMRGGRNGVSASIVVGNGSAKVIVHLDDDLLEQAARYARIHKTSLPKMITRGLRGLLAFEA